MTKNSIPGSDQLPPKSLNEDTQGDELPENNVDERRAPPVNTGESRTGADGVADADPETGRIDQNSRIPAPQTANRQ